MFISWHLKETIIIRRYWTHRERILSFKCCLVGWRPGLVFLLDCVNKQVDTDCNDWDGAQEQIECWGNLSSCFQTQSGAILVVPRAVLWCKLVVGFMNAIDKGPPPTSLLLHSWLPVHEAAWHCPATHWWMGDPQCLSRLHTSGIAQTLLVTPKFTNSRHTPVAQIRESSLSQKSPS